ncbi:hypothetical protein IU469_32015 [Nocardia puris]|uniref:hypothetical protein n=1 Tax=Nocardia puris TaxID=208602 RepID=UPI0011BE1DBC|nr:hypothetical protein [Nocardia puris]MBF6370299.1 hypothetical protein [Nocardia puris]
MRRAQAGALLHGLLIQLPGHLRRAAGPGMTGMPITAALGLTARPARRRPTSGAAAPEPSGPDGHR